MLQKFRVTQTITIEAEDVKDAAIKASHIIRAANYPLFQVVDRLGYTFNVEMAEAAKQDSTRR